MSAHSGHTGSGAIFAALGANLGIAVLKFIAYLLTLLVTGVTAISMPSSYLLLSSRLAASSRYMKGTRNGMTLTELRNGSGYRLRCL